jgi:hypothetical protein
MKDYVYIKTSKHTGELIPCTQKSETLHAKYNKTEIAFHIGHKPDIIKMPSPMPLLSFLPMFKPKTVRLFAASIEEGRTISVPMSEEKSEDMMPPHTLHTVLKFEALNQLSNMRQAKTMMLMMIIAGIGIGCLIGFVVSQMWIPREVILKGAENLKFVQPANVMPLIGAALL